MSGRRGRPSGEDYASWAAEALRLDLSRLEGCAPLAQLPGVQALCRRHAQRVFPVGSAIRTLFDQAASDVAAAGEASGDPALLRVAVFLHVWYRQRGTVAEVAEALELSRSRVSRAVKPLAVELVTRRFLGLASGIQVPG